MLRTGESIFLYTDGVTEAISEKEEMFSEEKTQKELADLKKKPVHELIADIMEKPEAFSKGVEQHDDITMMMLKFYSE